MNASADIGTRLLLSRRDLRWNQDELADRSGISRTYISDIERGKAKNVSIDVVFALAAALEVSPAYLLGLTDDPLANVAEGEPHPPIADPALRDLLDLLDQMTDAQKRRFVEIARLFLEMDRSRMIE